GDSAEQRRVARLPEHDRAHRVETLVAEAAFREPASDGRSVCQREVERPLALEPELSPDVVRQDRVRGTAVHQEPDPGRRAAVPVDLDIDVDESHAVTSATWQ